MTSLITCNDLALGYENHIVVDQLNITVESGDYLCIVGDNGSGKSTLVKGLLGLIKPLHGTITMDKSLQNTSIGYVPQQRIISEDFPATVYEVVLSGCLSRNGLKPFFGITEKKLAYQNMEKLNISNLKKEAFSSLSGGQKQRVLIARALCATDRLLILDEPVNGLDPSTTLELYQLIKDLNESMKTAIIMVSHDIENVITQADKILHLRNKPLFFGTASDYKSSKIGIAYLGGHTYD